MEIKSGDFGTIINGLNEILAIELPVKTAYWLARFLDKFNSETTAFEKARLGLVKKHANKDEKGEPAIISKYDKSVLKLKAQYLIDEVALQREINKLSESDKDVKEYDIKDEIAFNAEFEVLKNEPITIDFKPIKIADLGDIKLKAVTLAQLSKLIEE